MSQAAYLQFKLGCDNVRARYISDRESNRLDMGIEPSLRDDMGNPAMKSATQPKSNSIAFADGCFRINRTVPKVTIRRSQLQ